MPDILTAQNLRFERGNKVLLDVPNLSINRHKTTLVLGQNGAGKSLLLHALHGLLTLDGGTVDGPQKPAQRMVFQRPILLRRTASEHFRFLCPDSKDEVVDDWFARAKLTSRMDVHCHALSGGEQQKLAVIGALASQPELLFLDEPTAHLDFESTDCIEGLVQDARMAGATIVMVSHNRSQAERLAEQILFVEQGQIIEASDAATFFAGPVHAASKKFLAHH